jgi:arylsulfatase A
VRTGSISTQDSLKERSGSDLPDCNAHAATVASPRRSCCALLRTLQVFHREGMRMSARFAPLCWIAFAGFAAAADARPNIVLIMADDFGYECVGANGGESYQTPRLDELAATGMRFEHCHVLPLCTPTRVQLMTGLYNVRNYVRFGMLPESATTFGHLLRDAGYATAVCGKWQLGRDPGLPQHFGFQESFLWQHTRRPGRYANPGLEHNGKELDYHNGEYGPDLVNDFALDFIERHREQPFFLYYPMILTHAPFQPTPDSPDWDAGAMGEDVRRNVRHFGEMTAYMDKLIGRVVDKLDELAIRENTLLIFLGDNGTAAGVTSRFQGSEFSGGKGQTTRRGTHVPLIVSWPAAITEQRVNADLIGSVDVLPTICDAAGVQPPAGIDGVSFLPQLRGEAGRPREWLYSWYSPRQRPDMTVREWAQDKTYKLYRNGRFFDLMSDPFEQRALERESLTGQAAAAADRLEAVLEQYAEARPQELDAAFAASMEENPRRRRSD